MNKIGKAILKRCVLILEKKIGEEDELQIPIKE